jgi:hypothetical protein
MNPSLDEVQSAINHCALQIIRSTQDITAWKAAVVFDGDIKQTIYSPNTSGVKHDANVLSQMPACETIHSRVTNDIEMVKNVLILTGAVQNLRNRVCTFVLFEFDQIFL